MVLPTDTNQAYWGRSVYIRPSLLKDLISRDVALLHFCNDVHHLRHHSRTLTAVPHLAFQPESGDPVRPASTWSQAWVLYWVCDPGWCLY